MRISALGVCVVFAPFASGQAVYRGLLPPVALSADGEDVVPPGTVRVFGSPRFKAGWVSACDFSRDGTRIVSAGNGGVVCHTYPDGRKVWQAALPFGWSSQLRYSADGKHVWAMSTDSVPDKPFVLYRLNAATGRVVGQTTYVGRGHWPGPVLTRDGSLFEADGDRVMQTVGDPPNTWVAADTSGERLPPAANRPADNTAFQFVVRADGRYLAVNHLRFVRVIDLATRREVYRVPSDFGGMGFAENTPRLVAIRTATNGVNLYPIDFGGDSPGMGSPVFVPPLAGHGLNAAVYPTPDGTAAVVFDGWGGLARGVDLTAGKVVGSVRTVLPYSQSPAFDPAGRTLAVGTQGIGFWSIPDMARLPHAAEFAGGYVAYGGGLDFSPDGRELTCAGQVHSEAIRWQVATGQLVRRWEPAAAVAAGMVEIGPSYSGAAGILPAGRSVNGRPFARLEEGPRAANNWPAYRFTVLRADGGWRTGQSAGNGFDEVTLTPDGRQVLATHLFNMTRVYDTTGTRMPRQVQSPAAGSNGRSMIHSYGAKTQSRPGGAEFAVIDVNDQDLPSRRLHWSIGVFDLDAGRELARYRGAGTVMNWTWSPDGRMLAVLSSPTGVFVTDPGAEYWVDLYRYPADAPPPAVERFPVPRATSLQFSSDGYTVATVSGGTATGDVRLWEVVTGKLRRVVGPVSHLSPAAFSPDGRFLAGTTAVTGRPFLLPLDEPRPPPSPADLVSAWQDLASADAVAAYSAVRLFRQHRAVAEPFVLAQPTSAPTVDSARLKRLVDDLGSPRYAARAAAAAELGKTTRAERAALSQMLAEVRTTEARERLADLLARPLPPPTGEELRAARLREAFTPSAGTSPAARR